MNLVLFFVGLFFKLVNIFSRNRVFQTEEQKSKLIARNLFCIEDGGNSSVNLEICNSHLVVQLFGW